MQYYIDSTENPSSAPEDAISRWENVEDAQNEAIRLARLNPETEYYVNKVTVTFETVYRAMATIQLDTAVVDGSAD